MRSLVCCLVRDWTLGEAVSCWLSKTKLYHVNIYKPSVRFFFYQGMGGKSQNEKQKRFQDPLVVLLYTYLFHISALYVIFFITPVVEVRIMSLAGALERVYVKPAIQTVQRFLKIACTSNTCLRFGKALPILVFFKLHSLRFWKHSIYIFFFAHCNIIGG